MRVISMLEMQAVGGGDDESGGGFSSWFGSIADYANRAWNYFFGGSTTVQQVTVNPNTVTTVSTGGNLQVSGTASVVARTANGSYTSSNCSVILVGNQAVAAINGTNCNVVFNNGAASAPSGGASGPGGAASGGGHGG